MTQVKVWSGACDQPEAWAWAGDESSGVLSLNINKLIYLLSQSRWGEEAKAIQSFWKIFLFTYEYLSHE